jgi:hypothetical protein
LFPRHQQPCAARDAHQRAGGVEQFDQEEHQHHVQDAHRQCARNVQRKQGRVERWRQRHHALELLAAKKEGQHRDDQDANQDRAAHFELVERDDHEEADGGQDGRRCVHVADGDQRRRVVHHDAGVPQCDQREEQANADRDADPQRLRNAHDDQFAQANDAHQDEQCTGDEDCAQRGLPWHAHAQHHDIGEVGVQTHAGRHRDRVVGVEAHDAGAQRSGQTGGHEHGVLRHARIAQDGRVDEDDVRHREEGGKACQQFGPYVGSVVAQPEESFEHLPSPSCWYGQHYTALALPGSPARNGLRSFSSSR